MSLPSPPARMLAAALPLSVSAKAEPTRVSMPRQGVTRGVAARAGPVQQVDHDRGRRGGVGGGVAAVAALQRVGAGAALERVIAVAAGQGVGPGVAGQRVVEGRAGQVLDVAQGVAGGVAARGGAVDRDHDRGAGPGVARRVDAGAAGQRVGPGAALEHIVAVAAGQDIRPGAAGQRVGQGRAGDVLDVAQVSSWASPPVPVPARRLTVTPAADAL